MSQKIFLIAFLGVGLLALPAAALDTLQVTSPDPFLEDWRWTSFDSDLAGNVQAAYVDREGGTWVGTDRGIQHYDGYEWKTYGQKEGVSAPASWDGFVQL